MCGVIGIIGGREEEDVSFDLYKGLLALQHRGQDSAGIACFHEDRIHLKKGVGLVADVFNEENLSLLKGSVGIGHVRYSTIGATPKLDAQPFAICSPNALALAHNGNLVNYDELRKRFEHRIESNCDAEVILLSFAHALALEAREKPVSPQGVFSALKKLMAELNGSYSAVCLVGDKGLLVFRDPHGIRPLVMGRRGNAVAFASESVALDAMGFVREKDLKPGEAVFVDSGKRIHSQTILENEPRHCMFEWVYFARPDSVIEERSVYDVRLRLGKELAKLYEKNGGEVVVPVPDTSRTAALSLAESLDIPFQEGLIKNRYVGRTFIMPTQAEREKAVNLKLNPIDFVLRGKRVLLVDDSIVRGTTARKIVELVKKHAASVHLFATCPPLKHPCYYGIDFPLQTELIAANKTVEEIRKTLSADALTYMTIEGLRRAIGEECGLCTACLTGEYPTKVTKEYIKQLAEARRSERSRIKAEEFKKDLGH